MKIKHFRIIACSLLLSVLVVSCASSAPRQYGAPVFLAGLKDPEITESSGLIVSRINPGIFWTHNDSGEGPYLYATDSHGSDIARYKVMGAENGDWEDIATGPGSDGKPAIYIGDIGDNNSVRKEAVIYRIPEPSVNKSATKQKLHTMIAEKFPYVYPDGAHDAETLLVYPQTGAVYVVTKIENGESGVYRYPMPLQRDRKVSLERVASIRFTNPFVYQGRAVGKLATGGCFSPDGRYVAIRTYTDGFEWYIKPGETLAKALQRKPGSVDVPWIGQFESFTYSPDGKSIYTTSEGSPCPLWKIPGKG